MPEIPKNDDEASDGGSDDSTCSALRVTAKMIREAEGHMPWRLKHHPPDRWQWFADHLNETIQNPGSVCECCNIARDGEIMDHLSLANAIGMAAGASVSPLKSD